MATIILVSPVNLFNHEPANWKGLERGSCCSGKRADLPKVSLKAYFEQAIQATKLEIIGGQIESSSSDLRSYRDHAP